MASPSIATRLCLLMTMPIGTKFSDLPAACTVRSRTYNNYGSTPRDFRYQALPFFCMQHWKAGSGLGTRLLVPWVIQLKPSGRLARCNLHEFGALWSAKALKTPSHQIAHASGQSEKLYVFAYSCAACAECWCNFAHSFTRVYTVLHSKSVDFTFHMIFIHFCMCWNQIWWIIRVIIKY